MRAWLIYDETGRRRNRDYIAFHREVGRKFGVDIRLQMAEKLMEEIPVDRPDFALVRTICPELSRRLEDRGIPVFNPWKVSDICNDKGKTIEYVRRNTDVPCVPTERYDNGDLSYALLRDAGPDSVVKAVEGHGGTQVYSGREDFSVIEQGIGQSDFVIQPFVRGPGEDIRVYVVGQEPVAAVKRRARSGFRANFSLGGCAKLYRLKPEERETVEKICGIFPFGMVGIDFIVNERGELLLNEIEDVVGARMLYQCAPDMDLLERYFSFIRDKLLQR